MHGETSTQKIQKAILFFASGAFIVSGIVIGLVSFLPLYNQMKAQYEQRMISAVSSKKLSIQEFLDRARDSALQVTSRSVLREKLEAYYAGKLTLQQLTEFTEPRLLDARQRSPLIVGITRLDKDGKPFAHIGESASKGLWVIPSDGDCYAEIGQPFVADGKVRLIVGAAVLSQKHGTPWD